MKKLLLITILFFSMHSQSQTYVKVNALTTLLGVPNVGIETSIGKKSTFQLDILASPWKSVNGKPLQFYIFIPEYRYHFKEKYNGLPQPGSAYAYDVIRILITAFEKEKTNEGVAKFISEIKDFLGVTGVLSVDSDGNINSKAVIKKIINGKFVEVK